MILISYFFLPFVVLIAAFIVYIFLGFPLSTPKPADFKIVNSSLIILNEKGKNLTVIRIDEIASPGSIKLRLRSIS